MTKHSNRKTAARAYAAEHGISYTEALRQVSAPPPASNGRRKVVEIQRGVLDNGHLPYPWYVLPGGSIAQQDFWRGDPEVLIGFTRDPETRTIDLYLHEWQQGDPAAATGMYAVCRASEAKGGGMALYRGAIESAEETTLAPMPPVTATFRGNQVGDFDVAEYLLTLSDEEVRSLRDRGWSGHVLTRFLYLAAAEERANGAKDGPLSGAENWVDSLDDLDDHPYADEAYSIRLDALEAEIFLATTMRATRLALPPVEATLRTEDGAVGQSVTVTAPAMLQVGREAILAMRWREWGPSEESMRLFWAVYENGRSPALDEAVRRAQESGSPLSFTLDADQAERFAVGWSRGFEATGLLAGQDVDRIVVAVCDGQGGRLARAARILTGQTSINGLNSRTRTAGIDDIVAVLGVPTEEAVNLVDQVIEIRKRVMTEVATRAANWIEQAG